MPRLLLRPGWILSHLVVVAIAVLFVNLGLWQLDRHREVGLQNDRLAAAQDAAPLPLDQALQADDVRFRPATATGTFQQDADVRLSPRSRNELPGYDVLTPLRLADGRVLLINRGWMPLDDPIPPPPEGQVALAGRLRLPASARQVLPVDGPEIELVSNPDLAVLSAQVPDLVSDVYLEVVDEEARQAGVLPRPAEPISLDGGDHLSYAVQWFAFTVIGLVGYPMLLRRRMADRRAVGDDRPGAETADRAAGDVEPHPVSQ